jgi:predicted nucleotidyltransferase
MASKTKITESRKKERAASKIKPVSGLNKELQEEIIFRITRNFKVKHIFLFGSYATGNTHKDSDIDLVVVLDEPGMAGYYEQRLKQRQRVSKLFYDIRQNIPMDFLVYTNDEWAKLLSLNSSFTREIKKTGIELV